MNDPASTLAATAATAVPATLQAPESVPPVPTAVPVAAADLSPVFAYHTRPSLIDFPGHVAAMLFTSGCNFVCGFCHNAESLGRRRAGLHWNRLAAACTHFRHNWVTGIVISGGEPTLSPDLPRLVEFLRGRGFRLKLDTNGSRPEMLAAVLPRLDYVAMDIKCALRRYPEFVQWPDTAAIARSVDLIRGSGVQHEFRTTVVEGVHDAGEFDEVGTWLQGVQRYVLQPFVPRENLPARRLRTMPRTTPQFLERLAERLRSVHGLPVDIRGAGH